MKFSYASILKLCPTQKIKRLRFICRSEFFFYYSVSKVAALLSIWQNTYISFFLLIIKKIEYIAYFPNCILTFTPIIRSFVSVWWNEVFKIFDEKPNCCKLVESRICSYPYLNALLRYNRLQSEIQEFSESRLWVYPYYVASSSLSSHLPYCAVPVL